MKFFCRTMKNRLRINTEFDEFSQLNLKNKNRRKSVQFVFVRVLFLVLWFFAVAESQDLPKEIRGYKVYWAKISVENKSEKNDAADKSEAFVKIGEPEIMDVSLAGITLEIPAEIESPAQSGTIDFVTFQQFRVNDLPVDVEEYKESFRLEKNKIIQLPKPIKVFLGATQTLRGAVKEFKESKTEWTLTGRIFVFGHFKKSFLTFKRVVPIEINLKIKNPLRGGEQ